MLRGSFFPRALKTVVNHLRFNIDSRASILCIAQKMAFFSSTIIIKALPKKTFKHQATVSVFSHYSDISFIWEKNPHQYVHVHSSKT